MATHRNQPGFGEGLQPLEQRRLAAPFAERQGLAGHQGEHRGRPHQGGEFRQEPRTGAQAGTCLAPKIAVPTRTWVAPSRIATSRSSDIPRPKGSSARANGS